MRQGGAAARAPALPRAATRRRARRGSASSARAVGGRACARRPPLSIRRVAPAGADSGGAVSVGDRRAVEGPDGGVPARVGARVGDRPRC